MVSSPAAGTGVGLMAPKGRDEIERRECLPVLAAIRNGNGWATKEELAYQLGIRNKELDRCIDVLQKADDLQVADLGRITLLVAPTDDVDEAIAQLFDAHEREWRARIGDEMPDLEDRDG